MDIFRDNLNIVEDYSNNIDERVLIPNTKLWQEIYTKGLTGETDYTSPWKLKNYDSLRKTCIVENEITREKLTLNENLVHILNNPTDNTGDPLVNLLFNGDFAENSKKILKFYLEECNPDENCPSFSEYLRNSNYNTISLETINRQIMNYNERYNKNFLPEKFYQI